MSVASAQTASSHSRPASSHSRPLVYVVEDDDELRRLLAESLRRAGFHVVAVECGRRMLDLVDAGMRGHIAGPDAIVMDVRMPRCNGIDVLKSLRAADWQQPVVLITAFGDTLLHAEAAACGASIVLDKPFDIEDLVGVLDVLLLFAAHEAEVASDEEPPTLRWRRGESSEDAGH